MECGTGGYRLLFRFSTRPSHHEERRGTRTIYQTEEYQFPPKRSIQKGSGLANEIGKGHSEEECLAIVNDHLGKYPCLTRADYCRLTGHDKQRALNELNAFIEQGVLMRYGAGKQVVYAKKYPCSV